MTQPTAQTGDAVTINFSGKLANKEEILSTSESGPFPFVIGDDTIFPKINDAIIGMKVGEKKKLTLAPADAFGEIDKELIFQVPCDQIPDEIEVGAILSDPNEEGAEWMVIAIDDNVATLNGNHPAAGQEIFFEVELVSIQSDDTSEPSGSPQLH